MTDDFESPLDGPRAVSYPYQPLGKSDEIRLLYLQPGAGDDEIACTISHASLGEPPVYEALSYTWGDNRRSYSIRCERHLVYVTENLHAGLHRLRYPDRPRTLWVDAICINQDDTLERNQQVLIMRNVYSGAGQVIVWLGEEVESDALAFNLMNEFDPDYANDHSKPLRKWDDPDTYQYLFDKLKMNTGMYANFERLLHRSWFRRLWVIQEVAMATSSQVVCGTQTARWSTVSKFLRYHMENGLDNLFTSTPFMMSATLVTAYISEAKANPTASAITMLSLLEMTQLCSCTDPRDRIFALLPMASDAMTLDVEINYFKEPAEVYKQLAIGGLLRKKDLSYLAFAALPPRTAGISPSWVPDWTFDQDVLPRSSLYGLNFRAGLRQDLTLSISESAGILSLDGYVIDTLQRVGRGTIVYSTSDPYMQTDEEIWKEAKAIKDSVAEIDDIACVANNYPTGQGFTEVFWRTSLCNRLFNGEVPSKEYETILQHFRYIMTNLEQLNSGKYEGLDKSMLTFSPLVGWYVNSTGKWTSGRVFCATNARYLGWVPRGALPGDIVCIFAGAEVPHILRHDGDGYYQILGDCYIHGIMEGEAMERHDLVKQTFQIR